jgi:hypothetical protein
MSLETLIENLIFKRKMLVGIRRDEYDDTSELTAGLDYATIDGDYPPEVRSFLCENMPEWLVDRWEGKDEVFLHVAKDGGVPVGYYWSISAKKEAKWYDQFPIPQGSGLTLDAYIAPTHRRRGLFRSLRKVAIDHLFEVKDASWVYTLVEMSNHAAMKAVFTPCTRELKRQYLVKFLGRNVLSVFRSEEGVEVYWVLDKGGVGAL